MSDPNELLRRLLLNDWDEGIFERDDAALEAELGEVKTLSGGKFNALDLVKDNESLRTEVERLRKVVRKVLAYCESGAPMPRIKMLAREALVDE